MSASASFPDCILANVRPVICTDQDVTIAAPTQVLFRAGKVAQVGGEMPAGMATYQCNGALLSPGFCDLVTYLSDPGQEDRGSLEDLAADAHQGGYSLVVGHGNSIAPIEEADALAAVRQRGSKAGLQLEIAAALTQQMQGKHMTELRDLALAGAVAFSDGTHPVQDAGLLMRSLQYLQAEPRPIFQLPVHLSVFGTATAAETPFVTALGLKSAPVLAETLRISSDLKVLAYAGGNLHISPVTTAEGVALIREAKAQGLKVTAGTSPAHLLLSETVLAAFHSRYRLFPPLRSEADRQALLAAWLDGTLDTIDSHHAPMSRETKQLEFDLAEPNGPTLQGIFSALLALIQQQNVSMEKLLTTLLVTGRKILRQPMVSVAEGMPVTALFLLDPAGQPAMENRSGRLFREFSPLAELPLAGTVTPLTAVAVPAR